MLRRNLESDAIRRCGVLNRKFLFSRCRGLTPVPRQNVIRSEDGASPCRNRLSENPKLPKGCSAERKILSGSNPRLSPTDI